MKEFKTIIIDDERLAREELKSVLKDFLDINIIDEAQNGDEGIEKIKQHKPDLIFLDVSMPGMTGFEMLKKLEDIPHVIFVTAYDEFALKAFEVSALDYLLKPIDIDELKLAVERLAETSQTYKQEPENFSTYFDSLKELSQNVQNKKPSSRIAISHTKGLKIVEDHTITHLEASGNCTTIYFEDGSRYLDTRTLKVYENLLDPARFARVHKSHIINLDILQEYLNEDGHFAVLKGNIRVPVARNRVTEFVKMLKQH